MEIILNKDCSYNDYEAAKKAADLLVEETGETCVIYTSNQIPLDTVTYEYEREWLVLHDENYRYLDILFPESLDPQYKEERIKELQDEIKELETRRDECLNSLFKNAIHVRIADDHDDACQEYLEASWERADIEKEISLLKEELEILQK